jgi:hypothetical protein
MRPQLFYVISDEACAAARRAVVERGVLEKVKFRNVHYEEVRRDLDAHHAAAGRAGAAVLPALWDGHVLHEGLDAVLAAIGEIR